jgi:hypothetical protein
MHTFARQRAAPVSSTMSAAELALITSQINAATDAPSDLGLVWTEIDENADDSNADDDADVRADAGAGGGETNVTRVPNSPRAVGGAVSEQSRIAARLASIDALVELERR